MEQFILIDQARPLDYSTLVRILNVDSGIDSDSLYRTILFHTQDPGRALRQQLLHTIQHNSSLRVQWPIQFESWTLYQAVVQAAVEQQGAGGVAQVMVTDSELDWLGFTGHDMFDLDRINCYNHRQLIDFNNSMVNSQVSMVRAICSHKLFVQHLLLKDPDYRYRYFLERRNSRAELSQAYFFYIDSVKNIQQAQSVAQQQIEQEIGCHFISAAELYFELLSFSRLTGTVYG